MAAPELTTPRQRPANLRTLGRTQRWGWMYQRISGVILIALIFTHLFVNLMVGDGVSQIDFAFVAGKWADPLWQWWDFAMLVLAMTHGTNGMRILVDDYARRPWLRATLQWALLITMVVIIVLGSLVIWTFDACPLDSSGDLMPGVPSFCESVV
ncbi:succinate dehydrogenase hydrophobic membrane anchor subunit [Demequina sp. NBRC 110053]|uniref:succinate dehydrogenase hydrophobic membrane anchor subunit n=1 Tax=Demequina sp. NBRC 110053 TaxID=1570342 RepID=UPI0011859A1B|nr:succinate dehydrogenase hydrophobic membrane anchor subunit [Demequina sp. NBRC 110053]